MIFRTLDACALITLINQEEGAEQVQTLLEQTIAGEMALNMHIINLTEVYYGYLRDLGQVKADMLIEKILSYPIKIINLIPNQVFAKAAYLKANYRISLADAYACATAWRTDSELVTSDHSELEVIERQEGIRFCWLPAKMKKSVKK